MGDHAKWPALTASGLRERPDVRHVDCIGSVVFDRYSLDVEDRAGLVWRVVVMRDARPAT